jgi:hypothetical protein
MALQTDGYSVQCEQLNITPLVINDLHTVNDTRILAMFTPAMIFDTGHELVKATGF